MKRSIKTVPFLILLFLLIFSVPVSANVASPRKQVKKTVTSFMKKARKMNVKKMEKYFMNQGQKVFTDPKKFYRMIRPYTKKMTWKIKKIKIKGNQAKVKIRIDFQSLYLCYWNSLLQTYQHASNRDEPPKNKKYFLKILQQEIDKNGGKEVRTTTNLRLRKEGGKWKFTKPKETLMNVLYCDYIYAVQDFMGEE